MRDDKRKETWVSKDQVQEKFKIRGNGMGAKTETDELFKRSALDALFYRGLVKDAAAEPFKGIVEFVRVQPSILTGLPPGRSFGQFEAMKDLNFDEQIVILRKKDGWQVEVGLFSKDALSFAGNVTDEALEAFLLPSNTH